MSERHEIPTHLEVVDRAYAGLTMRQLLVAAAGLALAYGAAHDLPLPVAARGAAAMVTVLVTGTLVAWAPGGRPLEEWVFVLARYYCTPGVAVWRPEMGRPDQVDPHEVVIAARSRPRGGGIRDDASQATKALERAKAAAAGND